MKRREFLTLVGSTTVAWPLSVHAQKSAKLPTMGFLGAGSRSSWSPWTNAFVDRLQELGWIDNKTVTIEYRWAEGRSDRYAEIAAEFVSSQWEALFSQPSRQLPRSRSYSRLLWTR